MADKGGYIGRNPGDSSVTIARQTNSLSGIQTTFTFTSSYTPTLLDVYLNGSRLIDITDYSATDGSTVTLTSAAESGDVIEFVAYKAFNIANPITSAAGNFLVGGDLTVTGSATVGGVGVVTAGSDASGLTGIVTSITAGSNISVSGATGNVTITGLANTTNVIADTVVTDSLVVTGISTLGVTVANSLQGPLTSTGVNVTGIVTATSFEGDGSSLTGIAQPTQLDITSSLFT